MGRVPETHELFKWGIDVVLLRFRWSVCWLGDITHDLSALNVLYIGNAVLCCALSPVLLFTHPQPRHFPCPATRWWGRVKHLVL
jgi:hypothetical protein